MVALKGAREKAKLAAGLQFSAEVYHALGAYAVGVWDFDEGENGTCSDGKDACDSSGNKNNGKNYGATWKCASTDSNNTPSGSGCSLKFDGSDYILISTHGIDPSNGTIEGWVKPNVQYPWSFFQTHDSTAVNWKDWIAMFMYPNGTFYFRMGNGSNCCSNDVTFSNTKILANKWSHLAFTWGGTTMKVYINGKKIASRTNAVFQSVVDPKARIGFGHRRSMNGLIDNVRIYSQALSSAQVRKLYAEGAKKHGLAER
jgi:hypothetical protein